MNMKHKLKIVKPIIFLIITYGKEIGRQRSRKTKVTNRNKHRTTTK